MKKKKIKQSELTNIRQTIAPPWQIAKSKQEAYTKGWTDGDQAGKGQRDLEYKNKFQLLETNKIEQAIKLMNSMGQCIEQISKILNPNIH
jgi:hypothetical protein